jgi:hypothetical protein
MKCQFVSNSSSLDGSRHTVSISSKGAADLCEILLWGKSASSFRIFIPRDDILLGDWMTLWMSDAHTSSCVAEARQDLGVVIGILRSNASWKTKVEQLKCCYVTCNEICDYLRGD